MIVNQWWRTSLNTYIEMLADSAICFLVKFSVLKLFAIVLSKHLPLIFWTPFYRAPMHGIGWVLRDVHRDN